MAEIINNTITHLKLPFQFDVEKLLNDLYSISDVNWVPHFNTEGYDGRWKAIALFAKKDSATDMISIDQHEQLEPTEALKHSPYFSEVIAFFQCRILSARILRLEVGSVIKPHRDYNLGYEDGSFRLHIPIVTNREVEFILGGNRLTMLPGECWYTNVNHVHSVVNKGNEDRVHLVIDGERNEWSDELFFSLAPQEQFFLPPTTKYSAEELKSTIEELERMDAVQHAALISQLRAELKGLN